MNSDPRGWVFAEGETPGERCRRALCLAFALIAVITAGASLTKTRTTQERRPPQLSPLGTNHLKVGDRVYFRARIKEPEPWTVQDLDYEYLDGEKGVILKGPTRIAIVPRAKVTDLLIER